jgi:hypothetical protein
MHKQQMSFRVALSTDNDCKETERFARAGELQTVTVSAHNQQPFLIKWECFANIPRSTLKYESP